MLHVFGSGGPPQCRSCRVWRARLSPGPGCRLPCAMAALALTLTGLHPPRPLQAGELCRHRADAVHGHPDISATTRRPREVAGVSGVPSLPRGIVAATVRLVRDLRPCSQSRLQRSGLNREPSLEPGRLRLLCGRRGLPASFKSSPIQLSSGAASSTGWGRLSLADVGPRSRYHPTRAQNCP